MTDLAPKTVTYPLSRLRFGHEANPPINVRKEGRDEALPPLAASLLAHGLRQALDVREIGGEIFVRDGNRRLAAMRLLVDRGDISADIEVACTPTEGNDIELGLAPNIERAPLHDIDQYEAFAQLADGGMPEKDIAGRFGVELKHVKRILALGRLSPDVRAAWRSGEIDEESAKAFTLGVTHEDQDRVLKKLRKDRQLYRWSIRQALGGGNGDANQLLKLVGKKAEELTKDGWGWAAPADDVPNEARWSWRTIQPGEGAETEEETAKLAELRTKLDELENAPQSDDQDKERELEAAIEELETAIDAIERAIEARGYTPEAKASAGCIVSISYNGTLDVAFGKVKPGGKASADKGPSAKKGPKLSTSLLADLSRAMTTAAAEAIGSETHIALAALLAGFGISDRHAAPVRVSHEGLFGQGNYEDRETYAARFDRYRAMSAEDLLKAAAGVVSQTLNLHVADRAPLKDAGVAGLLNAIDGEAMNEALVRAFDPADYFKRAPMAFAQAALKEMPGKTATIPRKKADVAKLAAEEASKQGWLPAEMRTAHYAAARKPDRKAA